MVQVWYLLKPAVIPGLQDDLPRRPLSCTEMTLCQTGFTEAPITWAGFTGHSIASHSWRPLEKPPFPKCLRLRFARLLVLQFSRSDSAAERWNPGSTKGDGKMPDDFSAAQALPKKYIQLSIFLLFIYSSAGCPKQLFYIQTAAAFLNTIKQKLEFEGIPCIPSTTLCRLFWCFPPSPNTACSFTGCYRIAVDRFCYSWKEDQTEYSITYALKGIYSPRLNS